MGRLTENDRWSICDVRTFLSLSLTCGPQTARTWIQSTTLFGAPFNRWYTVVEVSLQWISWKKQSSQSGPSCHSVSLTAQLINGVVGFNALSSSKEDTLNILCNEIHPCNVTVKTIAVFLWIFTVIIIWIGLTKVLSIYHCAVYFGPPCRFI